jgi:hypothetical protein
MNINKGYHSSELEYLQYKSGNVTIVSLKNIVTHHRKGVDSMKRWKKYYLETKKMWKEARLVEQRNKEGVSFRDFVLDNKIDVKDIADKCKVTQITVKKWINGKQWPSFRNRLMIKINFGYQFP